MTHNRLARRQALKVTWSLDAVDQVNRKTGNTIPLTIITVTQGDVSIAMDLPPDRARFMAAELIRQADAGDARAAVYRLAQGGQS